MQYVIQKIPHYGCSVKLMIKTGNLLWEKDDNNDLEIWHGAQTEIFHLIGNVIQMNNQFDGSKP